MSKVNPTHIVFEEEQEEEQQQGKQLTSAQLAALCPSKTRLVAKGLGVSHIENLKFLSSLRGIDVSNNLISDLSFLKDNVDVVWLHLSHNRLNQLKYLEKLRNLEVLNVSHNQLRDLAGVERCEQLRALVANDNKITSIDCVIHLFNLNTLVLSRNYLQDITCVRSVVTLKKLSCSHNQLRKIPDLSRLVQLTEVRLNDNLIDRLPSTLVSNRNLKVLDLGHNRIRNREELSVLSSLPSLKVLNLAGNPVAVEEDFQARILKLCPNLEQLNGKALVYKKKRKRSMRNYIDNIPVSKEEEEEEEEEVPCLVVDDQEKPSVPEDHKLSQQEEKKEEDSGCIAVEMKKAVPLQIGKAQPSFKATNLPRVEEMLAFGNGGHNQWL
ncbi:hypothetical protein GAYE_SCF59G6437 [Galdieria yellowstonensis]|uniref:Uncharacterized protein n=1 Tax=Galdieria yellowstonensis TaxID=3028027 RepID=A0AAV9IMI1_9RHOD|nr:hypothetical protein GAYE_SCF59G6437 [Galdieria yellowstonensis]